MRFLCWYPLLGLLKPDMTKTNTITSDVNIRVCFFCFCFLTLHRQRQIEKKKNKQFNSPHITKALTSLHKHVHTCSVWPVLSALLWIPIRGQKRLIIRFTRAQHNGVHTKHTALMTPCCCSWSCKEHAVGKAGRWEKKLISQDALYWGSMPRVSSHPAKHEYKPQRLTRWSTNVS